MTQRSRGELVALLLLYVLPLAATVVLLAAFDLWVLAGALVAIELCVVSAIALARRRPERGPRQPVSGSAVVGGIGVVVIVSVVAAALVSR
jgi:membrane protein implicated in regulation of membrane protease activity